MFGTLGNYMVKKVNLYGAIFVFALQAADKATRFNYLLQQTEIFAHFMNTTTRTKKQPTSPLKMKAPQFPSRSRKLSDCGGVSTCTC